MHEPLPETYPITGLCIVADPTKCPPNYEVLLRSEDRKDDCDLWKDGLFRAKVTRYLCVTREYRMNNHDDVLVDVVINSERDFPPIGFTVVEHTVDTREKATRKKQICTKKVPRTAATDAITEIILLSRSKRPPSGYTLIGEINGIAFCFKMGPVPAETVNHVEPSVEPPASQETVQTSYVGSSPNNSLRRQDTLMQPFAAMFSRQHPRPTRRFSLGLYDALNGVPFTLNSRFQGAAGLHQFAVPEISYRSEVDIESQFNYQFNLETQTLQRNSPTRE